MGGCTSKQERRTSVRSAKKEETSNDDQRRSRRKLSGKEMDEKEIEWSKERKKLREEVMRLRKKVEEEREYWKWVVEEMCLERAVRNEAVDKWKQLYLAIKNELDHLIIHHTTTSSSSSRDRKLEEEAMKTMEELRYEVRAKEDTIETLKERIALMDRQKYEKERDIDLLRQSLRILGSKKKNNKTMNLLIFKDQMCL